MPNELMAYFQLLQTEYYLSLKKGELGREEKVVVNFPLDRLFTGESKARLITTLLDRAGAPLIASIFGDFVTISFEDWFGVLQKPRFKSKNAIQWSDVINSIMAAKSPDTTPISLRRKELDKFRAFVTFLSSEKAISPLEFDPVSRVISIRGSQIFIGDNWTVTASSGIKQSVEEWINFFVAKNRW